jgi:hypothetical protein
MYVCVCVCVCVNTTLLAAVCSTSGHIRVCNNKCQIAHAVDLATELQIREHSNATGVGLHRGLTRYQCARQIASLLGEDRKVVRQASADRTECIVDGKRDRHGLVDHRHHRSARSEEHQIHRYCTTCSKQVSPRSICSVVRTSANIRVANCCGFW